MRQRPLGIAGAWQRVAFRVFAPQRGLWCMGSVLDLLCIGLFLDFHGNPAPLAIRIGSIDHAHHGLPARVHMHVLHGDLLALATVLSEPFKQVPVGGAIPTHLQGGLLRWFAGRSQMRRGASLS